MVELLTKDTLERICKGAVVVQFVVPSLLLPGGAHENNDKPVRALCVPTEIRTVHLSNETNKLTL
jgi:hypothetical protein